VLAVIALISQNQYKQISNPLLRRESIFMTRPPADSFCFMGCPIQLQKCIILLASGFASYKP